MEAPTADAPRLTVHKLTLFSHGVANLELTAEVEDDATLHLSFPERHMNDVLKTLTAVDTSDGTIGSISYEAPWKLDRDQPTVEVNRWDALRTLLVNSQGARVVMQHREEVSGKVLGLQPLLTDKKSGDDECKEEYHLVLLQDGCRISAYNVSEIHSIRFVDEQIQKQLERRMNTAFTALRAKNSKSVTITAKGSGRRSVLVNYAVESPVPKMTYRFLLKSNSNEDAPSSNEQSIFVQGWAIVDNPMDEDLEDIHITIVSGLPISFRHDLYGARYVERPKEEVPTADGPGYSKPSGATFGQAMGVAFGGVSKKRGGRVSGLQLPRETGRGRGRGRVAAPRTQLVTKAARKTASVQSDEDREEDDTASSEESSEKEWQDFAAPDPRAAETAEVGDLFEYNIPVKVSIRAQESALVPLIMQDVEGSRVDVYSHKVRESNTLSAVRIKNTTSAAFEGGPVSLYERSRLVGEGMMKTCRPGVEQFVPYSVNLDCLAEMKSEVLDGIVVSTIAINHYFKTTREKEYVWVYSFQNKRPKEMELYVLHEMQVGFAPHSAKITTCPPTGELQVNNHTSEQLEEATRPIAVREGVARYKLSVPGSRKALLRVCERRHEAVHYDIRTCCTEVRIAELMSENVVREEMASKMREVMELETLLASIQGKRRAHRDRIRSLEAAQERHRKNLSSLGGLHESNKFRDDPLIGKLLKSLATSEVEIEQLEDLVKEAEKERDTVEEQIQGKIAEFAKELGVKGLP